MIYHNLQGKVVMVTGASSGLGEALAHAFGRNGCKVYLGARSEEKLQDLAKKIELFGVGDVKAIPLKLDVTDYAQVNAAADYMVAKEGRIDIWVNNAGGETPASILDITPQQLKDITAVNYFGLVYGTQAAAKQMIKQKEGDIVQILSTSAFTPRANELGYCSAKAAAAMATECSQLELKQYGIRVIPISPGGMATNFAQNAGLQMPSKAMKPEDIAEIVLHAIALLRNIKAELRLYRQG